MARIIVTLAAALACVSHVLAHGHVTNIVVNGVYWEGYDPTVFPYESNPPVVVGWTAADTDNGFVAPDAYQNPDIICHKNATPAGGHALVKAGDSISIQWTAWPSSHLGPVIDYLAACNGSCETVDKTQLEFFKIDGDGYNNGTWGTAELIADNNTWLVQIPADLAPGNYVLRHELIALHSAETVDGAQNYPQCFNLAISGTGTATYQGTLGTELYNENDPGIVFNIYTTPIDYTVPGPTLIPGVSTSILQSSSTATATSSAVTPGSGSGSTTTTTTAQHTSTTAPKTSTTLATTTTPHATTTTPAATTTTGSGSVQSEYGQCGGSGWTGPTACASPYTCQFENDWYSQCL